MILSIGLMWAASIALLFEMSSSINTKHPLVKFCLLGVILTALIFLDKTQ